MQQFLTSLFEGAESAAQKQQQDFEKSRSDDIEMWRGVLVNPSSSPEQRTKAANEIGKLRNIKKGENPFTKVADHLNTLGEHLKARGGTGRKILGGLTEAAGIGLKTTGNVLTGTPGQQPKPLPPLDPSAFPTAEQIQKQKTSGIEGEEKAKLSAQVEGMAEALKKQGFTPDQIKAVIQSKVGGAGMRKGMHPVKVADPNDPTRQVPALQDPYSGEVYGPGGQVIDNPQIIPVSTLPTNSTTEQVVIDPKTGGLVAIPIHRHTEKVAPKELPGKPNSTAKTNGATKSSGTPGARPLGNYVRPQQFNALQKQATAIDEARNSLVGDDPGKVAGLAGDLEVFKSPESVERLGNYLALVTSQMENEGKAVAGQGPLAAVEWYTTLPQTVVGLQQGALREASKTLDGGAPDGPEHRFVADYFRTMGTIGGMRAATGASSAKWSFNTLRSELPTPGPVTSYKEAVRRVNNYLAETNVVSKRNPLMQGQSAKSLPGLDGDAGAIYARDPQGKLHKAPKGTPLPPGWKLENAASNATQ